MKSYFVNVRMKLITALAALVVMGSLSSCLKNNNDDYQSGPAAGLMAFNLATDKSAAGFSISGNVFTNNYVPYAGYTGTYISIYPGARTVESFDNMGTIATSGSFNFADSNYYSTFLVGAAGNYRNIVVKDDLNALASGKAYIRYVNAIPDSSQPTVAITAGGTDVVREQAAFAHVSDFKEVSAGSVAIDIANGGTIAANRTITVETNKIYTVLLVGQPSGTNPVEIRYIVNGVIDANPSGRIAGSAATVSSN